jgi:hypothetical protein
LRTEEYTVSLPDKAVCPLTIHLTASDNPLADVFPKAEHHVSANDYPVPSIEQDPSVATKSSRGPGWKKTEARKAEHALLLRPSAELFDRLNADSAFARCSDRRRVDPSQE